MPVASASDSRQAEVRRGTRARELRDVEIAQGTVEVVEQPLAAAEQHGGDGHVQLVDEPGAQVLLDGRRSTTYPDVLPVRGLDGTFQGRLDALAHEVEVEEAVGDVLAEGDPRPLVTAVEDDALAEASSTAGGGAGMPA